MELFVCTLDVSVVVRWVAASKQTIYVKNNSSTKAATCGGDVRCIGIRNQMTVCVPSVKGSQFC